MSGFAVAAALLFARFSRPTAKILFSNQAVIGPYHGTASFGFRIANGSPNELIEVEVRILLCMSETRDDVRTRYFHQLNLERHQVAFFRWTGQSPIRSPKTVRYSRKRLRTCATRMPSSCYLSTRSTINLRRRCMPVPRTNGMRLSGPPVSKICTAIPAMAA